MQTGVMLCVFPWGRGIRDPMGRDALCYLLGLGAGRGTCLLGTCHNPFSQAQTLDMALEPARSFARSSSAQVTTPQFHNFPGWLLISASRCSFQHASASSQPLPGGEAAGFGRGIWEHPLVLDCSFGLGEGIITQLPCPSAHGGAEWTRIFLLNSSLKQPARL